MMKIIILIVLIAGLSAGAIWFMMTGLSEEDIALADVPSTVVKFSPDTLLLGKVKYDSKKEIDFEVENVGENPLIIREIRPSCGCTEVKWRKKPVRPGESIRISVVFKPNSLGQFMKTIAVVCNTEERIQNVVLKGLVDE